MLHSYTHKLLANVVLSARCRCGRVWDSAVSQNTSWLHLGIYNMHV